MTATAPLVAQLIDPAEDERLAALARYDLLDTPPDAGMDDVAELVRNIFGVERGVVSLIDAHRQWHKARAGAELGPEAALPDTFCRVTLTGDKALIVPDARQDSRFRNNPMVTGDPNIRFYAGVPLRTPDGFNIGTICAIGNTPRETMPREAAILESLSRVVMETLDLRQRVAVDALTGVSSRRAFKDEANRFVALARRHRGRLSVIGFDLDHFKRINDTYGHAGGDRVLTEVSRAVASSLRQSDIIGRLGGEEFGIVLPETDAATAFEVAEKLRRVVQSLRFPGTFPPIKVTASFGVAMLDPGVDDLEALLGKADLALYEAKKQGRNRCIIAQATEGSAPAASRRRVLKAASIIFNNRMSAIDCTVRALSEDGAELSVINSSDIPDKFTLRMRADGFEWRCSVVDRQPTKLDVTFE